MTTKISRRRWAQERDHRYAERSQQGHRGDRATDHREAGRELETLRKTHTLMTSDHWEAHRTGLEEGAACPLWRFDAPSLPRSRSSPRWWASCAVDRGQTAHARNAKDGEGKLNREKGLNEGRLEESDGERASADRREQRTVGEGVGRTAHARDYRVERGTSRSCFRCRRPWRKRSRLRRPWRTDNTLVERLTGCARRDLAMRTGKISAAA